MTDWANMPAGPEMDERLTMLLWGSGVEIRLLSATWEGMGLVWDRLVEVGFVVTLRQRPGNLPCVAVGDAVVQANTPRLALCRAAGMAMEEKR